MKPATKRSTKNGAAVRIGDARIGTGKLLDAFRCIPSKIERRALVVLAEGIAYGRLGK
jgi:hypothetical protein